MTATAADDARRHLLIVYHSQTGNTRALAEAVLRGAHRAEGVEVRVRRALAADLDDLLWCHALLLGTPENFGYMSGAMKYFLDRVFYPAQGRVEGLPYALFVSAGNDGTGAVRAIERIARGFPWKPVSEPLIVNGEPQPADLEQCEELGEAVATGLAMGIF